MLNLKNILVLAAAALFVLPGCKKNDDNQQDDQSPVHILLTSDAHYGITRPAFRGATTVDAHTTNAAMIASMNTLPGVTVPNDGGFEAGQKINYVDYMIQTGDVANRMEVSAKVQLASTSWDQFNTDYLQGLTVKGKGGNKANIYIVPGNHDVSNTIGYYATMSPTTDATSLANLYNRAFLPAVPKTAATLNYATDRVNYSRDIAGVHFCFMQMWPDSTVRIWLNSDLQKVSSTTPVVFVCHDQPAVVANHFTNPNGNHGINGTDKFDNVLDEVYKDGKLSTGVSTIEQRNMVAFLKQHPNVKAWLHGHVHESRFYTYTGVDNDVQIGTVSIDSPMKGLVSAADETKLCYDYAVLDPKSMTLTVRECFWNTVPTNPNTAIQWGAPYTIKLK
ncbi:calcineurin-like phosphoesterase family protein [Mucilaginibacter yixingensis]|uniref:Calcineurin-like phosphoesterase family protein n=1 Tax=Mucilaginibacter yixingensis TaxID=1295612 RepID=A0A2T5JBD6_9SPHI|nr:metallophosphoesterase [Mucilaginibacter yixingensis]PTQ98175.1 calcineurin-like phosphoesterase family protein [Mucilaginibacter yixingensis]